jgi:RNA polymerase sigma factor (sigma-70 family)
LADQRLVNELLAHSRGASQRFIARYDAFFRQVILWSSPAAPPLVDDLTQEVYVCLWAHDFRVLRQWKCEHPLRAYLRTVIVRLVWERLNHLRPRREELGDVPLIEARARPEHSAVPATPEQLTCAHELLQILSDALEGLSVLDRHILHLRYFHDLSYREIAEVLGITITNVGVRLTRSLVRLRGALLGHIGKLDVFDYREFPYADFRSPCNKIDAYSLIWLSRGGTASCFSRTDLGGERPPSAG